MYFEDYVEDVLSFLIVMFGIFDDLCFLSELRGEYDGIFEVDVLVLMEWLWMVVGFVFSDKEGVVSGFYWEYCVYCYGIFGDGVGLMVVFFNLYFCDY